MLTSVQIVAQPAVEPVSIDLARLHGRIDQGSDDLLLQGYLRSARTMAEAYLSRALITQTLLWTVVPQSPLQPWVHHLRSSLDLPRAPVQSISSVTAVDVYGNSTAIPAAALPVVPPAILNGYVADLSLAPATIKIGPETLLSGGLPMRSTQLQHIQVTLVAGYGVDATNIPQPIIDAILLTTAFLYEHRGDAGGELPQAAQWLLDPYRLHFFG